MPGIALKIDVDTYRGTLEGVPRLAALLDRLGVRATFLFSLGPDHTGRAIKRAFRSGFLGKVRRTSVLEHYGLKTLLYGTLLPGPDIGRKCGAILRDIASRGFEVGIHTYDHVRWQDGVAGAGEQWTQREMQLAYDRFAEIFGRPAHVHGAAGWQMNAHALQFEQSLGLRYASDVRGSEPFVPVANGGEIRVPQLPTTLPTLDELIGRDDLGASDPADHLLLQTGTAGARDHVFTLHSEIEGGAYIPSFERLLKGWLSQGYQIGDLAASFGRLDVARLPRCRILEGSVPGRAGVLACQGPPQ